MHNVWYSDDNIEKITIEIDTRTTQPWQTYWRDIRILRRFAIWHVLLIEEPEATIPTRDKFQINFLSVLSTHHIILRHTDWEGES